MVGMYSEKLKTGGELKVSSNGWSIEYYFRGPDLRYNGTFVSIRGECINQYIDAWKDNFKKYHELKKSIPSGGSFEASGDMSMSIRIGGFAEGVCLHSYHMPIRTEQQLNDVINDYEYARTRSLQILSLFQNLK